MKKNLLAVAVLAAMVSPLAAQAETTLYGHIDVSADAARQSDGIGAKGFCDAADPDCGTAGPNGGKALANNHWSQISSNTSYLGVKGSHPLGGDLVGLYQIESGVSVVNEPGAPDAGTFSFGSRNSYVGLGSHHFGAIKVGKNDTPYKTSTGGLDPFSNTVGDYNAIIGNTGGDNRVEFNDRLPHAIWYESPKFGGANFNILYMPSQKKNGKPSSVAVGEPECTGHDQPFTDFLHPADSQAGCRDGGFNDALSADLSYNAGPIFATAAYELHRNVDRSSADNLNAGIENEQAFKIGAAYNFGTNRLGGMVERLRRGGVAAGRNKTDYYISDVQKFAGNNELDLAWAHAGKSDSPACGNLDDNGAPVAGCVDRTGVNGSNDDSANLYAVGLRHHFNKWMSTYVVYATDRNKGNAHYGLGQSGHDQRISPSDTRGVNFQALSVGATIKF